MPGRLSCPDLALALAEAVYIYAERFQTVNFTRVHVKFIGTGASGNVSETPRPDVSTAKNRSCDEPWNASLPGC
jgi:hypothetical protein